MASNNNAVTNNCFLGLYSSLIFMSFFLAFIIHVLQGYDRRGVHLNS